MAGSVSDIIAVQPTAVFRDQLVVAATRAAAIVLGENPANVPFRKYRVALAIRILENPREFKGFEPMSWQVLSDATVRAAADAANPGAIPFAAILAAVAVALTDQVKVAALANGETEP